MCVLCMYMYIYTFENDVCYEKQSSPEKRCSSYFIYFRGKVTKMLPKIVTFTLILV